MPVKDLGDPRLQALFGAEQPRDTGVRPTLALPRRGLPIGAIAAIAVLCAIVLFTILEMRRTIPADPPINNSGRELQTISSAPPPLYIPPAPVPEIGVAIEPVPQQAVTVVQPAPATQMRPAPIIYSPPMPAPMMAPPIAPPQRVSSAPPLVIDSAGRQSSEAGASGFAASPGSSLGSQGPGRVRASTFASRSLTVPQGHLIPAVLETGFDSTQPGFARAIVSRDVRSFDGKNVLIPRGSRLIGRYQSQVTQGQNRAIISWTRLIRPDGMTIAMDSPAVDPLGKGGVPATVNTHFMARLGDALLQSTVSLGSVFASRAVTGPVVMVPGAVGNGAQSLTQLNAYVPTLTVPAGKSISVFVAHDLEFTTAALRP